MNRALISAQDLPRKADWEPARASGDEPRLRYRLEVNRDEESSSRLRSMQVAPLQASAAVRPSFANASMAGRRFQRRRKGPVRGCSALHRLGITEP